MPEKFSVTATCGAITIRQDCAREQLPGLLARIRGRHYTLRSVLQTEPRRVRVGESVYVIYEDVIYGHAAEASRDPEALAFFEQLLAELRRGGDEQMRS